MRWRSVAACVAVWLLSSPAHTHPPLGPHPFDLQLRVEASAQHLSALPSVRRPPEDPALAEASAASAGLPARLLGLGFGADMVVRDRYLFPLMTIDLATTLGRYPRVYVTEGDHVAVLRPWTAWQTSFFVLGVGIRRKHRRWSASAMVQPGLSVTMMEIEARGDPEPVQATGLHGTVRATASGCRRLDPERRLCAFVGANLYLDGWLNGGLLGLRMEMGP